MAMKCRRINRYYNCLDACACLVGRYSVPWRISPFFCLSILLKYQGTCGLGKRTVGLFLLGRAWGKMSLGKKAVQPHITAPETALQVPSPALHERHPPALVCYIVPLGGKKTTAVTH